MQSSHNVCPYLHRPWHPLWRRQGRGVSALRLSGSRLQATLLNDFFPTLNRDGFHPIKQTSKDTLFFLHEYG